MPDLSAAAGTVVVEGPTDGETAAAEDCEFCYLCVPTPQAPDGSADLSFIRQAASAVAPVLPAESVVVTTVTPEGKRPSTARNSSSLTLNV